MKFASQTVSRNREYSTSKRIPRLVPRPFISPKNGLGMRLVSDTCRAKFFPQNYVLVTTYSYITVL